MVRGALSVFGATLMGDLYAWILMGYNMSFFVKPCFLSKNPMMG